VPTAFYIHTTPDDERDTVDNKAIKLAKSHGCVHIVPEQRDQMISAGYLKEGVTFEVRSYSERADP
jgi:hypothetical protein